ncbi:DUF2267 domain-containing protein [Rhodospira trueperi]|uniref:Uncharacterized conserved protein, DUF2267 family n=1 Tax=Rhodospira trueperi TaxID=69960 RepID=A0A1G7DBD7_9PROT|nr:DUF2267 domain-containing protein [Rhodospira trueperi]SDE48055.1 Uncharacterized conserved protein, DUF2267 family [Rhodospira trueperi]
MTRIDHAYHEANIWLNTLAETPGIGAQGQAYGALRVVLHQVRDRVTVDQAAHVGGQLPTLIRGIDFEGWKLAVIPTRERSLDTVLESLGDRLADVPKIDGEEALVAEKTAQRHGNRPHARGDAESGPRAH